MVITVRIVATGALMFLLSACGTPNYGAYHSSALADFTGGYTDKQLSNTEWEVLYSGEPDKSYKLALYRAAEIVLSHDFYGFELTSVGYEPSDNNRTGETTIVIVPSNHSDAINFQGAMRIQREIKDMNPEFFR